MHRGRSVVAIANNVDRMRNRRQLVVGGCMRDSFFMTDEIDNAR